MFVHEGGARTGFQAGSAIWCPGSPLCVRDRPIPPLSDIWAPDPVQGPDRGPEKVVGVTWFPSGGQGDAKGMGVASETEER